MAGLSIALLLSLLGQNSASPHSILVPGGPSTRFVRETMATAVDPAGRMTVMTKINGQGPYPFTIDTGANRSVISDRLAQELGLAVNGTIKIEGLVGPDEVSAVRVDHMKAGTAEQHALDTAVLPASSLGSTGFLGTDMLQGRNVVLDFKRHRIILTRFEGLAAVGATDGETITVDARRRLGQLVLTDASVGGVKVVAIIDTGAENTIGNPALRKLLMGTKPSGPTGQLIGVTGKWIPGEAGYVPKIRIGKMSMGNMPIVFADPHTFRLFKLENTPAILVGMDVLRMFDQVAIDFSRQEVRFNISQSWNPRTLQALNRPKTEGTDNGSARLLARADPAGAGVDTGGNLFRH
jgi:predicted aspartyl protease